MGAWGHGHLENDTALDFVGDLEEAVDVKGMLKDALLTAVRIGYLDSNEASIAMVAAAFVDSQENRAKYLE